MEQYIIFDLEASEFCMCLWPARSHRIKRYRYNESYSMSMFFDDLSRS